MIVSLTLNPAIDRELTVPAFEFDKVLRAPKARVDIGGKGFNVSRMLKALGQESTAVAFAAGHAGRYLEDGLQQLGIQTSFIWLPGESRTNVSIVNGSRDHYLKVNETGPTIPAESIKQLMDLIARLVSPGSYWILSGSLPLGVPTSFYADIISLLQASGAKTVLDSSGAALQLACRSHPFLVKPNEIEAQILSGLPVGTSAEITAAAASIRELGVRNVIISLGKKGAILSTADTTWLAKSPVIKERNPIGAGDSLLAAYVYALERSLPDYEALCWGVAAGAATASLDGTDVGTLTQIKRLLPQVTLRDIST